MRLFHTELEAVYEEKNRSLDSDYWLAEETFLEAPLSHPQLWSADYHWNDRTPQKSIFKKDPGILPELLCAQQYGLCPGGGPRLRPDHRPD